MKENSSGAAEQSWMSFGLVKKRMMKYSTVAKPRNLPPSSDTHTHKHTA